MEPRHQRAGEEKAVRKPLASGLRRVARGPLWAILIFTLSCGSESTPFLDNVSEPPVRPEGGTYVLFDVSRTSGDFYALPFPCDMRRTETGAIDLSDFPNPYQIPLVDELLGDMKSVDGFSMNAALYMGLNGPIDPLSLPRTPAETLSPSSSVFLVDIDPDSPDRGKRVPLTLRFTSPEGTYSGANVLAVLPLYGFGLREDNLYGLAVTREILDEGGNPLGMSEEFFQVLSGEPRAADGDALNQARILLQPLFRHLQEEDFGSLYSLAGATVFRTRTVEPEMAAVSEYIFNAFPIRPARDIQVLSSYESEHSYVLEGTCTGPAFQRGQPPYCTEGDFVFDPDGRPVLQREEELRFCLSVPKGTMPGQGWPLVVYGHGTGGNYKSFLRKEVDERLGEFGIAVISTDEPLHGLRANPPGAPEYLFYNFLNPIAGVDNHRQSAADKLHLFRFGRDLVIDPEDAPSGESIFFDPEKVGYMGHSQGGITGALMLGLAPNVGAAVLSGTGGGFGLTLVERTDEFTWVKLIMEIVLRMAPQEKLDSFHPIGTLLQTLAESADPLSYARNYFREPVKGVPVNLFLSEGIEDTHTPPVTTEALAAQCGAAPSLPVHQEVEALVLQGIDPVDLPARGNVSSSQGEVTAVLIQYLPGDHWALFATPERQRQYALFLHSYFESGLPTLPAE